MCRLGLSVPPGFTIATSVCEAFYENGERIPDDVAAEIEEGVARLEQIMGRGFGDPENPLLVSVRSGAAVSMPGMMDSVLNLGLNDETAGGLGRLSGDRRFALDAQRRLTQMFGDVVLGIEHEHFEDALAQIKAARGATLDTDLDEEALGEVVKRFRAEVRTRTGEEFPDDPRRQLRLAIEAVFASWNGTRARRYRELNEIHGLRPCPDD